MDKEGLKKKVLVKRGGRSLSIFFFFFFKECCLRLGLRLGLGLMLALNLKQQFFKKKIDPDPSPAFY